MEKVQTKDLDRRLDFFPAANEAGDGYVVAAIDARDEWFKVDKKRRQISYEPEDMHSGVLFRFKKKNKRLVLMAIDAWQEPLP